MMLQLRCNICENNVVSKLGFCPDFTFLPTNFPIVFASCRIGGAVPIVFSFFSEVLSREKRGEHLSWLCMFWMIGEIYASAMAWAIIPHYGEFTVRQYMIMYSNVQKRKGRLYNSYTH